MTMLTYTGAAPTASSRHPPPTSVSIIRTLTAKNLAKVQRSHDQLKNLAVEYVNGRLVILEPTGALAARIFGLSQPTMHRATTGCGFKPTTPADHLVFWWQRATPEQRDAFVSANLTAVWDVIDRVTR
jgi:hypothetical protein